MVYCTQVDIFNCIQVDNMLEQICLEKNKLVTATCTAKNTVIIPNFLVWEFCEKAQFTNSFGRIAQNYAEIVSFHKFPHQEIRWNYDILCRVDFLLSIIVYIRGESHIAFHIYFGRYKEHDLPPTLLFTSFPDFPQNQ